MIFCMPLTETKAVVLLMLDLSAAFDTVSHEILLDRLSQCYGISGSVLKWFASYLSSRTQFVQIEGSRSSLRELNCSVPQGSVLGRASVICFVHFRGTQRQVSVDICSVEGSSP